MTRIWNMSLLLLALIVLPLAGCAGDGGEDAAAPAEPAETATAEEAPAPVVDVTEELAALATLETGDGQPLGEVRFFRTDAGVRIVADLEGVEGPGMHGFHIHENGVCEAPDFKSAGGHFNPMDVEHACPPTAPRHAGDLGNLEVTGDGSATYELTTDLVSLDPGATSIIGKAVILHSGQDDCQTQPTGDAGSRQGCGLIALSSPSAEDTMVVEGDETEGEAM